MLTTISNLSLRSLKSDSFKLILLNKLSLEIFFFATFKAFWDISIAVTSELINSFARDIAKHPEPVPISRIFSFFSFNLKLFNASSTINSVSGLGSKTSEFT